MTLETFVDITADSRSYLAGQIKGLHKYEFDGGKTGVMYSDGLNKIIIYHPDDIVWNGDKTKFTTKRTIRGITIIDNDVTGVLQVS